VLFLLILALIVSLLPAGDSIGFFGVLRTLVSFLVSILFFLGQLLISLIILLLSIPFFLFGVAPPGLRSSPPPPMPVLPPAGTQSPATSSAAWAFIRSGLLWGALVLIVVFALVQFVRQHGGVRAALRNSRVSNWLLLAWQWLSRSANTTRTTLSGVIANGWQTILSRLEAKRIPPPASFIRLRSLDPRRQVYFFYLALIRRGEEQGLPRKPSQTPSEYASTLEQELPSADEDIESMTQAFVEARYSCREVDPKEADLVRAMWGRIRRALQVRAKDR
jgi:hypothetical protein